MIFSFAMNFQTKNVKKTNSMLNNVMQFHCSGLMYNQNISVRRVPEVVARSGSVLLHFFSDDAYNMSGFNISYKINGCPTDDSSVNCSGHGVCNEIDGACDCNNDYYGFACQIPKCPNECARALGRGHCDGRR